MGRKPTPDEIKLFRGNPGKRPVREPSTPPPSDPDVPEPPEWLSEDGQDRWRELGPVLHGLGLLTTVDVSAFAHYCWCYGEFRRAAAWLEENGHSMTLRDNKGVVKNRKSVPEFQQAFDALAAVRRYESDFGLTPSARTSLSVPGEKKTTGVASRQRA